MAIKIKNTTIIDDSRNVTNAKSATFTGTGYVKLPSGTTAQRPNFTQDGMIRFNTDQQELELFKSGTWSVIGAPSEFTIKSNAITTPGELPIIKLNESITLEITDYDSFTNYTITTSGGTATRTENIITFTPDEQGLVSLTINDEVIAFLVDVIGQAAFTTPGTYLWTAPDNVTSVSVVTVGGGGGAYAGTDRGRGGGGGGLGWRNEITVIPGESYTVVVGAGGSRSSVSVNNARPGDNSYFIDTATVCGFGGRPGNNLAVSDFSGLGGEYVGDGGGAGGNGAFEGSYAGGGGGAGGYSGNGGSGGLYNQSGTSGSGGGAGGGGGGGPADAAGNGGGVGIFGEGASGAGGTGSTSNGSNGFGGSGGQDGGRGGGLSQGATSYVNKGGDFGGGGGGADNANGEHGDGGSGAVRIIWGLDRAFPSTNTGDL
jgi:hypothetical protein